MRPEDTWAVEAYMPSGAEEKGRLWIETSKGRKASHRDRKTNFW